MAEYHVIPQVAGASDSNAGSKASPWVTIQKAATTMVAGDSVYIAGNWTYKELVTLAASGTSGNQISFIADVTGEHTGYGGIVLISSVDDPNDNAITRSYCWNQNGKEFITIRGFTMFATTSCIYDNQLAGNRAYEGVIIEDCALQGQGAYSIDLDLNAGVTPTGNGLTIRRCACAVIIIRHENNASAHTNVKVLIENVRIHKYFSTSTAVVSGVLFDLTGTSNTFGIGGVTVANCTIFGGSYGIEFEGFKNTTNISRVISCRIYSTSSSVQGTGITAAAVEIYSTASTVVSSGVTDADQFVTTRISDIWGGFADFTLYRFLGWSPYLPSEPISVSSFASGAVSGGSSEKHLPTEDMYGNSRGMGRPNYWSKYYFNASDNAVSDPNGVWSSDANIFDSSIASSGLTSTVGSSSSNYIFAGGTNAPASGGTITDVHVRIRASGGTSRTLHYEVYTDALGETLASVSRALDSNIVYAEWTRLTTPSGGWDWAKVGALETKIWMESGGSGTLTVYGLQLAVSTESGHSDIGAVEARAQPVLDSTVYRLNTYSAKLPGAGYHNDLAEVVSGVAVKISRWVKWDANYVGTKPQMVISNIPGAADITVTASGSADTWYELTTTFTPTASGAVLVKIKSNDASTNGNCWFADDSVTFP